MNAQRQIVYSNLAFFETLGGGSRDSSLTKRPGEAMGCVYAGAGADGCGSSDYCAHCGALKAVSESIAEQVKSCRDCQLLLKRDGETSARDLRVYSCPWGTGEYTFYVVTIMDVGHEKRRRVLERVFFHDLMNAAGGAAGLVDLLYDESSGHMKESLETARFALEGLVDEIKTQSRLLSLETGEYVPVRITVNASEVLESVAAEYAVHPTASGKVIERGNMDASLKLKTDPTLLRRVLGNLTVNALEATAYGGGISIGVGREGKQAVFRVHNTRCMPDNVKYQVFKRSFSTKGGDRGLGTYSVKLLTENYLEGETGFATSEQEGTTFWVKLDCLDEV